MLTKFSVSNFKSFNKELVLDLQDTNAYTFNQECVRNGVVNCALIYGHNGVGKSNLGLAIFDIIGHLTDRQTDGTLYTFYSNAINPSDTVNFKYEFNFSSHKVTYEYQKSASDKILSESFSIDDEILAFFDRSDTSGATIKFAGAESLKRTLTNPSLSLLKYIINNSELDENEINNCFKSFFNFIEGMLYFRSLQDNVYLGVESGGKNISEDIIEHDNVKDFQQFLNRAGVECKLAVVKESDKDVLAFDFNGKTISFFKIASSGTKSLALFYYWFQRLKENKVSFLYIDEFDAFYHHELSALIVEELKKIGLQFVLTSHNTSIITNDLLRPDCYFLMHKESIKSLARSTSKELRVAHNIEKMYKAKSFHG